MSTARYRSMVAVMLGAVAAFAGVAPLFAGPRLFPGRLYEVGAGPIAVVAADFDGDGRLDLASANDRHYTKSLSVPINRGDGEFADAVHYPVTAAIKDLAAGDFDLDGYPDIAIAGGNRRVYIRLNNGDGTFRNGTSLTGEGGATSVVIADFNGDGLPDVAATYAGTGVESVTVFLQQPRDKSGGGSGDPVFAAGVRYPVGAYPVDLAVADLNGDGSPNLATAEMFSGAASVLLNAGDGTFGPARAYMLGEYPYYVGLGDLDGDDGPNCWRWRWNRTAACWRCRTWATARSDRRRRFRSGDTPAR